MLNSAVLSFPVGQDCYTRIWSLQDAHLLRTIPSPHPASKDAIPSVVFSSRLGGRQGVPGLLMAVKQDLYHFSYNWHNILLRHGLQNCTSHYVLLLHLLYLWNSEHISAGSTNLAVYILGHLVNKSWMLSNFLGSVHPLCNLGISFEKLVTCSKGLTHASWICCQKAVLT